MTLHLLMNKHGEQKRLDIDAVYSISEAFNRLYFHYYVTREGRVDIENFNLPKEEVVDMIVDLI